MRKYINEQVIKKISAIMSQDIYTFMFITTIRLYGNPLNTEEYRLRLYQIRKTNSGIQAIREYWPHGM